MTAEKWIKLAKIAGVFASGAIFGGGIGFLIATKKYEKKLRSPSVFFKSVNDQMAKDIQSGVEEGSRREGVDKIIAEARKKLNATDEEKYSSLTDRYSTVSGMQKPSLEDFLACDANKKEEIMTRMAEREHPEDDSYVVETENGVSYIQDDEEGDPYFITSDVFIDTKPHYDKVSLRYYKGDMTLCEDDTEEILADKENFIGNFEINTVAPGELVHLRAPDLGADFEIEVFEGSYHEIVLGMTDEEWNSEGIEYDEP